MSRANVWFNSIVRALIVCSTGTGVLSAQIFQERYEQTPLVEVPELARELHREPSDTADNAPKLFRFVEGIDQAPTEFSPEEFAREIHDPFGLLLASMGADLPKTLDDVLTLMGPPGAATTPLSDQTAYVVSASGQIPISRAPNLIRRPRGIILRRDSQAKQAVFIAPAFRATSTLEIMSWDQTKQLFNFYERRFSNNDANRPVWLWKGDSSQGWDAETRESACFRCHRNGEVNMKELRLPWQNWHSQSSSIKPESISADSPLRTNPLFSIQPPSPFLRGGDQLEHIVNQWIARTNATKIERFQSGSLTVATVLEPFFLTTTGTLTSSVELSAPTGNRPIVMPTSMFIDQRGLVDIGGIVCDKMMDLTQKTVIPRSDYRRALVQLNFRLEDPGHYIESPGDTHFALLTSEVPRVDYDLVKQLVERNIVSRLMATNLMLIDFVNPVYSPIRNEIYKAMEQNISRGNENIDSDIKAFFEKLAKQNLPNPVRVEVEAFLARDAVSQPEFERIACQMIDAYLSNLIAEFEAGNFVQYMKLVAARHEAFRTSNHRLLIEDELLLAKTDPFPGLVMQPDGAVAPFPRINP